MSQTSPFGTISESKATGSDIAAAEANNSPDELGKCFALPDGEGAEKLLGFTAGDVLDVSEEEIGEGAGVGSRKIGFKSKKPLHGLNVKSFTNGLEIVGFIGACRRIAKRLKQNQSPKLKTDTLPLNYSPSTAKRSIVEPTFRLSSFLSMIFSDLPSPEASNAELS